MGSNAGPKNKNLKVNLKEIDDNTDITVVPVQHICLNAGTS